MSSRIDYATLPYPDIPMGGDASEFTYAERRSEIYDLIGEAGHPRNLERSQTELAARYNVSQRQISYDIEAIREYEAETSGDDADANTEFVIRRSVRGLLNDGDWREAASTQLDYYDWLFDKGEREKEPDRKEYTGEDGGPIEVSFSEEIVTTPWEDDENGHRIDEPLE